MNSRVKKWNQYLNENLHDELPEREMKYFSWILEPGFKSYKQIKYDEKMETLRKNEEKYNLIFDILDYMDVYNKKVGINKNIKITNLDAIINKNLYNLKEIKHKWMKLSKNPDIKPEDIFTDFRKYNESLTEKVSTFKNIETLTNIEKAKARLQEINTKNKNKKEYSLGDVMLLIKYEKELKDAGYSKKEIENLSPSYYES